MGKGALIWRLFPCHNPGDNWPGGIILDRQPMERVPGRMRNAGVANTILGYRPNLEITPATNLNNIAPIRMQQR